MAGDLRPGAPDARYSIYSASRSPFSLLVTFLLSLPSFFVLNTIPGCAKHFGPCFSLDRPAKGRVTTTVLAALAPFTAFWYLSFRDYNVTLLFNGMMFGIATLAGQWMLRASCRCASNPRHRTLLRIWVLIYAFIAIRWPGSCPFLSSRVFRREFLPLQRLGEMRTSRLIRIAAEAFHRPTLIPFLLGYTQSI